MYKFDENLTMMVQKDLEFGNIPMLLGEPGIGKSSWVEALASRMGTKCFTLPCNQLADKADLTGARLVPCGQDANGETKYKQVFFPHDVIHEACEYAKANPREYPILFLDELNRTTPDVTSEALSIPTLRKIGSIQLPKNLRVVTAGNDKGNVTSLDSASISRFTLYMVAPDLQTFIAVNPELNEFIKKTLIANPATLFCKSLNVAIQNGSAKPDDDDTNAIISAILEDGEEMHQFTTPRTLTGLSKWLNSFTKDQLLTMLGTDIEDDKTGDKINLLQAGIESHVGKTDFSSLLIQEIINGINTVTNTANTILVQKPACYDSIMNCADMTALNTLLPTLAGNERACALMYMLTEPADRTRYLEALALTITNDDFTPHTGTMIKLAQTNQIDEQNLSALVNYTQANNLPLAPVLGIMVTI